MKNRGVLVLLVLFCIESGTGIQADEKKKISSTLPGLKITTSLQAIPLTYSGACPTTVVFDGKISVNRAATVVYQYVRPGLTNYITHQIEFPGAGSKRVRTVLKLNKDTKGMIYIKILSPLQTQSNNAHFEVKCRNPLLQHAQGISINPFDIKVEQMAPAYYLGRIHVRSTLLPKSPVVANNNAIMKQTIHFFIGGKYIGKVTGLKQTFLHLSQEKAAPFNIKPGTHELKATAWYKGKAISGSGTFTVGKANATITELSSPALFYKNGTTTYGTCHTIGDPFIVVAKFTHSFLGVPIRNTIVYFRHHGSVICSAKTDDKGVGVFNMTMDSFSFFTKYEPYSNGIPFHGSGYNFQLPSNELYQSISDIHSSYRILYACPKGTTFIKSTGKCYRSIFNGEM